ncbi:stalk domain-containing protein [Pelotomaculum propionicicum]|uniref:stalk domain-containing protein n=1 Tax=Pelotomaculum propionicicum TaxID=258475 RepID=UPI003B76659E
MPKKKTWLAVLFLVVLLASVTAAAAGSVPNVTPEMETADFWIGKLSDPDSVIMSQGEISAFNRDIIQAQPGLVFDLTDYPSSISGSVLSNLVTNRPFPVDEERYCNGWLVERAYYDNLLRQMNLPGIGESNKVAWAVTVRRSNIRTFPTYDESLEAPDDIEFDLFQETAVSPAEPVLVLHRSLDGSWCFVQIYNYNGWMPAADLAVAEDKDIWLEYVRPENYLVVTGNKVGIYFRQDNFAAELVELTMGARVPLAGEGKESSGAYSVKLPVRGDNGELLVEAASIPAGSDVSVGYMRYTRANIIRQAFKILGERYGWGGMFNGRDCSAFVMDVYKSFGLMLPRNGDEQERSAGRTASFESLGTEQRYGLVASLLPGASLHTPTHEMLYLGEHNGLHYVIHDITSYGEINSDGSIGKAVLNRVAVTDLSLTRRNGMTFIDSLTGGKQIEPASMPDKPPVNYYVSVFVNGDPVSFPDQQPYLDTSAGRVYVPLRFVSEALGADVEWVQEEQKIVINKGNRVIMLHSGSREVYVDSRIYTMDVAVELVNGRNMVPLRFVSEALGAQVEWTASGRGGRVDITE